jgi:hypothetical protein
VILNKEDVWITVIKESKKEFSLRFSHLLENQSYLISTLLDPRYKCSFFTIKMKRIAKKSLKRKMNELTDEMLNTFLHKNNQENLATQHLIEKEFMLKILLKKSLKLCQSKKA